MAGDLVLVARIEDTVATVTQHNPPLPSTPRQQALLAELQVGAAERSRREADALIRLEIGKQRLQALRALRPFRGDKLVFVRSRGRFGAGEVIEVSSIDRLGQVWAKDARGHPAWPQDLQRVSGSQG